MINRRHFMASRGRRGRAERVADSFEKLFAGRALLDERRHGRVRMNLHGGTQLALDHIGLA